MPILILWYFLVVAFPTYTCEYLFQYNTHPTQILKNNLQKKLFAQKLLSKACLRADLEKLSTSLRLGASVSEKNVHGEISLHMVCLKKNKPYERAAIARKLISLLDNPSPETYFKVTPLHMACCNGSVPLVKTLVDCNASLHALDNRGDQPLQSMLFANISLEKKWNIALILLDKARQNNENLTGIFNKYGNMPLHETLYSLKFHTKDPEDLKYQFIKLMLEHTPCSIINLPQQDGKTALRMLLEVGSKHLLTPHSIGLLTIAMLIKGSSPEIKDNRRCLPIHYASQIIAHTPQDLLNIKNVINMLTPASSDGST